MQEKGSATAKVAVMVASARIDHLYLLDGLFAAI